MTTSRTDEAIRLAIDRLDNCTTMLVNGKALPDSIHVQALRGTLPGIVAEFRSAVQAMEDELAAAKGEGLITARAFHEAYERLAPQFGYETRAETREFDPESPNGKLMIAVCRELAAAKQGEARIKELEQICMETYQVVGSLLSDVGLFGSERGDKVLDNLSNMKLTHKDILPWDSVEGTHPAPVQEATKLWLWKNGPHEYWAFDNAFPIDLDSDDPQTLGEPCGYALVKPSRPGRPDVDEVEVMRSVRSTWKGTHE